MSVVARKSMGAQQRIDKVINEIARGGLSIEPCLCVL